MNEALTPEVELFQADRGSSEVRVRRHGDVSSWLASSVLALLMRPDGSSREVRAVDASASGPLRLEGSADDFSISTIWTAVDGSCPHLAVELELHYTGDSPRETGIRVPFRLIGPGRPTWLIPALFYGENRLPQCRRIYPRYDFEGGDPEALVSDHWSFRADRAALPAVFAWNDALCAAACTEETSPLGTNGLGFRGGSSGTEIWLDFPFREEPVTFTGHPPGRAAQVSFHRWRPGDRVRLTFRLYLGAAEPHAFDPFLREMYRRRRDAHALRPWIAPAEAASVTADALVRWHYRADEAVLLETVAFDRELAGSVRGGTDRPAMHVSWISGAPYAGALLASGRDNGDTRHVEAATRVLDKIASGIAPCGAFWGEWRIGKGWGAGWNGNPRWLHARTLAEATLFMVRALVDERERGQRHPTWDDAVRSNLRFATSAQSKDGDLGTYYDAETGAVEERAGAAGILWIVALVEGARYFGHADYLAAAQRAGDWYRRFVDAQFIYGAPEDVHLAPTSEDGYNALMAFLLLHEADGSPEWLALATRAADWMLTFRWTYNVAFPEHTMLGKYDFRTRGGDAASSAIQIIHNYGLICLPELVRLWRLTGDEHYLERARDNLLCFLQFVARRDGDFNAYRGMVTERYYHTDAFQAKGMMLTLSHAWCVGMTLYGARAAMAAPDAFPAGLFPPANRGDGATA